MMTLEVPIGQSVNIRVNKEKLKVHFYATSSLLSFNSHYENTPQKTDLKEAR